jgi:hypothetical protein
LPGLTKSKPFPQEKDIAKSSNKSVKKVYPLKRAASLNEEELKQVKKKKFNFVRTMTKDWLTKREIHFGSHKKSMHKKRK